MWHTPAQDHPFPSESSFRKSHTVGLYYAQWLADGLAAFTSFGVSLLCRLDKTGVASVFSAVMLGYIALAVSPLFVFSFVLLISCFSLLVQGVLQMVQHKQYVAFCREYAANRQPTDPPLPKAVWLVSSPNGKWFRFAHSALIILSLTAFTVIAAFALYALSEATDALVSANTVPFSDSDEPTALVLGLFFRLLVFITSLSAVGLVYFLITPLILLLAMLTATCLSGSLAESSRWIPLVLLLLFPFLKIYTVAIAVPAVAVTVVRCLTHIAYKKGTANP